MNVARNEEHPPEAASVDRDDRAHEAFAAARRMGSVVRPRLAARLAALAERESARLVVVGLPGAGKSTLVAQWCAEYRRRHPDPFLIVHHVGAAATAETGADVARRLIEAIRRRLRIIDHAPADSGTPIEQLPLWLAHAAASSPVLVVDGIDQLAAGEDFGWFPAYVPPGLRLVVTSTSLPAAARDRQWSTLDVRPLTQNERAAFGARYAEAVHAVGRGIPDAHRRLSEHDVASAVEDAALATPLALRVRLEELRLLGPRAMRAGSAAHLTAAADVTDLMGRLISCWERDFGDGPVRELLTAVWGARYGLTRNEIALATTCSELDLADMLAAFDLHLAHVGGLLRFHHDAFRRAVAARYLDGDAERERLHLRLAEVFAGEVSADRRADERPWHLAAAGRLDLLRACITQADVVRSLVARERQYELIGYWNAISGADAMVAAYESTIAAAADRPPCDCAALMHDVGLVFRHAGRYREALDVLGRAAAIASVSCTDHPGVRAAIAAQLAHLAQATGDLQKAEEWFRSALEVLRLLHGDAHHLVARTLAELSDVLAATSRHDAAEEGYRAALEMMERTRADAPQVADVVNGLAATLHEAGRHDEAEALYRRALELWRTAYGDDHPTTVVALNNLAALLFDKPDHDGARALRERVVALWERALGPEHPMVATALSNLAGQIAFDDPAAALPLLERARAIHATACPAPSRETTIIIYSIGRAHFLAGRLEEAGMHMRRAYELQCAILGVDSIDTAVTLGGLGIVARDSGDLAGADQLLSQALATLRHLLGERHPRVGMAMITLGGVARRRGDLSAARELVIAGVEVLGDIEQLGSAQAAEVRGFLASVGAAQPTP